MNIVDNKLLIIDKEPQIISNYLINTLIGEREEKLYIQTIIKKNILLNVTDERLWRLMMSNRLILSFVDSGLALLYPNSPIRERICIMLAILETQSEFINSFFIEKHKIKETAQLFYVMVLTPFRAIIGIIIIKLC